ncbi:M1 family metallopeptidase [Ginsengibacter hankyongi]|uniref:M1 family metallopeptidase n=1 Tax=Ginsengibacter hankyongi TaxID=2607284 RepID=A0A5J5IF37_9BACT|nr:M1 family metallopeptidase [Ginsengibacter hankyongi]KAA9037690.1 M1 family metallopeptidase [Ginsengibacter hankyongi]
MKKTVALFCLVHLFFNSSAQPYTHADTSRGSNGPGRVWWDATKYDLHVKFNLEDSSISGYNEISFKVLKPGSIMQIDLQEAMIIDSIKIKEEYRKPGSKRTVGMRYPKLLNNIIKEGNVYFISLNDTLNIYNIGTLFIYYHGKPRISKKAPWDGGIVWARDKQGNPWISIACQGLGASVWYPCKDYQGDEPDSAEMHITAPSDLVAISNGRMRGEINNNDGTTTTTWAVVNPINNYDLIPYLGKYTHFGEIYKGEKGNLTLDYWVLDSNLTKAKKQFKEVHRMMKAFEYWFGPYPFYEDGYKLIDAPYLGMEHQSAVAYGNGYLNGYHGMDLSGTGVGMKWDFIIVHESGHEWFGNNITSKDIADSWIHEGFTNYSETLFTEYWFGKEAADKYVIGIRKNIENKKPIISPYGVNADGPIDIYYKAANMLHTIRQVINDDTLFRNILRGLNKTFYHQTVTSRQIEAYISKKFKINFSKVFDQYLRTIKIPTLTYKINNGLLSYRWTNVVPGFNMPLKIYDAKGKLKFIYPKEKMQQLKMNITQLKVDENFYIYTNQIN